MRGPSGFVKLGSMCLAVPERPYRCRGVPVGIGKPVFNANDIVGRCAAGTEPVVRRRKRVRAGRKYSCRCDPSALGVPWPAVYAFRTEATLGTVTGKVGVPAQ